LRWAVQTGVAAVSVRPTLNFGLGIGKCQGEECYRGLRDRASSYGWSLSDKDMKLLSALSSPNDNPTLFSSAGCPNAFVMPTLK
jgi:hypothetical protein